MKSQWYLYINGVSDLGSRMHLIAMTALIFTFKDPAFWMMTFFLSRQVGGLCSSFFAGQLADRLDRKRLMIWSDLICGSFILLIILFPSPWSVLLSAFMNGVFYSIFQISFQSSIPEIYGEEYQISTNTRIIRLTSLAGIMGFTIGGWISDHFGYIFVLLFDAVTFLLSALALFRMRWETQKKFITSRASFIKDSMEAASYIRSHPWLWISSFMVFLYAYGTSAWNYGFPILAHTSAESLGSSTLHGLMWSTIGAGSFLGSWLWIKVPLHEGKGLLGSMMIFAIVISTAFMMNQSILILLLIMLAGIIDAGTQLYTRVLAQQAENYIRGRVLGLQSLLSRAGFLFGFAVTPWLTEQLAVWGMVLIIQLSIMVVIVLLGIRFLRSFISNR